MSTSSAPKISQGMENNSELRKVGEEMTTGKTEEIDKDLDANQYMDIDEFMEVLRDVELITPFGKLESTPVDAAQIDDKTVELQHCYTEQSDHRCLGTGGNLRAKHTVLQVVETVLDSHKNSCKAPSPCSKQRTQKVLEDAIMTNYLFCLMSQNGSSC